MSSKSDGRFCICCLKIPIVSFELPNRVIVVAGAETHCEPSVREAECESSDKM
jgi:hypothetical protein